MMSFNEHQEQQTIIQVRKDERQQIAVVGRQGLQVLNNCSVAPRQEMLG
jgi:hypothetical protein